MDKKTCSLCKKEKPLFDFSWFNKGENKKQSRCKTCCLDYSKKRYHSNLKQIERWLIRKEKEVKRTYSIFKTCTKCKVEKPMVEFPPGGPSKIKKDGTDPKRAMCIPCEAERQKLFKQTHKDRLNPEARMRMDKYRKENPEKYRDTRLKSRKKQRDQLDDGYIKRLLCRKQSNTLKWEDITDDMINLYRTKLKITRKLKESA